MRAWPLFVLMCSHAAVAQFRLPSLIGVWHPVVGEGAIYQVVGSDGSRSTLEIDCVGSDSDGHWLELTIHQDDKDTIVKQLLGKAGLLNVILKKTGEPAVEVPPPAVVGGGEPLNVRQQGKLRAHEHLTMGGQSYATDHFQLTDGSHTQWDVWVSPEVPPCDLVCLKSATITLALQRRLEHVHSRITETPQPLDMP